MPVFESYRLTEYNSFYEFPIYRLDPVLYENELRNELDRICNPLEIFEQLYSKDGHAKHLAHRATMEAHISYLWKFNEIVGWILLNYDHGIITGDLFFRGGKRITKRGASKIEYKGEAFRLVVTTDMSNFDVYLNILKEIDEFSAKPNMKRRYFDKQKFDLIGRYLDWKRLFSEINS